MTDLPNTELATALILGLTAMDYPPNRKWDDARSEEARDAARRLATHIRALVPDLGELARVCVALWLQRDPSVLKETWTSYHGPDVFRTNEVDYAKFPDDSGWDPEGELEPTTWAERNGLKAEEEVFGDKAVIELHQLREQYRRQKAAASQEKRQQRAQAKWEAEQRETRQRRVVAQMMTSATVPSSDMMH